ncbi:ribosome biogenesis GTPase YlqF [Leptolyngbya sp. PCC 6406]|uniref:ribosome biogenesis GTPase YlqF n=1 Tax=Leptolyngbya sp. PCC 6406 TaxID=1173264 RepID=UPI0002ABEB64|nr:ribosome biogenesis GTPase YlqF [Leptolyngbya sp. PCC 6406]
MPPDIQWYPGHIAKAEKALLDQLKRVDVVLEVRDARIPLATRHPRIQDWIGEKGHVLVMNRVDMISTEGRAAWETWLRQQGQVPYFANAQQGKGVSAIAHVAQKAGIAVNERRLSRGMRPRPVRAVVIGFPNVGKSALINRLLKRKVVASARRAGITRQLRWIRISDQLELLDAPGILPAQIHDQDAALKLAICDDIGEASYDNQRVAAALVDLLKSLGTTAELRDRYRLDPESITGETFMVELAQQRHQGDQARTAHELLNDFRKGLLGTLILELPPL